MQSDSRSTSLIIIRGNSASGKTRVAHEIRKLYGYGVAIVSQDVLRRDILKQKDDPGNPAIGLIDITARYALEHGYHTIVEGILFSQSHADMLTKLVDDHTGPKACFYYELSFDETVTRHATKPQSAEYGADMMANWYRDRDVIPALNEKILGPDISLDKAASLMMESVGLLSESRKDHS